MFKFPNCKEICKIPFVLDFVCRLIYLSVKDIHCQACFVFNILNVAFPFVLHFLIHFNFPLFYNNFHSIWVVIWIYFWLMHIIMISALNCIKPTLLVWRYSITHILGHYHILILGPSFPSCHFQCDRLCQPQDWEIFCQ